MLDLQFLIVALLIAGAAAYAVFTFVRKSGAFSKKSDCADDCGCSAKSKPPKVAH